MSMLIQFWCLLALSQITQPESTIDTRGRVSTMVMMEICDNGLDDDGDGRVDIFDPDCQCAIMDPPNLVPNGAFEETTGCCADLGVNNCLEDWIVLGPSPDYISDNCRNTNLRIDVRFLSDALNETFNEGYVFSVMQTVDDRQFTESVGVCLTDPMEEGKTYEVSFDLANLRNDAPDIPFSLVGVDRCDRLNVYDTRGDNSYCKLGLPFVRLGTVNAQDLAEGWNTLSFEVTPTENIEAIFYSADCDFGTSNGHSLLYMVFDNVKIREKVDGPSAPEIDSTGQVCLESVRLSVPFDPNLTYQWYKDSTLVPGATDTLLRLHQEFLSPAGIYHVSVRDMDQNCALSAPFLVEPPASVSQLDTSICEGVSYDFGDQVLTWPGTYRDTLSSVWGCDSIVELSLAWRASSTLNLMQQICPGDTIDFGGARLSTAGFYQDTLVNSQGCDSIITLELSVWEEQITNLAISACAGETYFFGGQALATSGRYQDTVSTAAGCDSILVLDFTVLEGDTTNLSVSICAGGNYEFGANTLTTAGTYQDLLINRQGCDSLLILTLTVLPEQRSNQAATICTGEDYNFGGTSLMEAGLYRDTLNSVEGCDSIVELELEVVNAIQSDLLVSICEGESYFFAGTERLSAGIYLDTLDTRQGCDSIIRLELSVAAAVLGDTITIAQPFGTEYLFAGTVYATAGFYEAVLTGANGCDSTAFLSLSFFDPCETSIQITADLFDPTCEVAANGALEVIVQGGFPPFQYALGQGAFQFDPTFTGLDVGEYEIQVLDNFGCLNLASFSLVAATGGLEVDAGRDTSLLLGNSVQLSPNDINFSAADFQWMLGAEVLCTNCREWRVQPVMTTVYTLLAIDELGCSASDEIRIEVITPPSFYIPNAFSPNDDGINDVFSVESTPEGLSRIKRLMIYSRWGDLLHESFDKADTPSLSWNGMVDGKRAERGVYVYCIQWEKLDGEMALLTGDVLLIR